MQWNIAFLGTRSSERQAATRTILPEGCQKMDGFLFLVRFVTIAKLLIGCVQLLPGAEMLLRGAWGLDSGTILYGLLASLAAVGLAFPFSLVRVNGLLAWLIIAFSTIPSFGALSDRAHEVPRPMAILWMFAALTELVLSKRLQPAVWSWKKCLFVMSCGVVFQIGAITVARVCAPQGPPYRAPAVVFHGDSKDLRQTIVVPTLDTPIGERKNVVWCGTFELAWKRLGKDVFRDPPRLQGAEALSAQLNDAKLAESDLPADSYLATAGFAKDGVVERVRSEMRQRFHKEVEIDALEPRDILAYAYLEASAEFAIPYFDYREPVRFRDSSGKETQVSAFGIEEKHEYAYERLREQIEVLHLLRNKKDREELDEFVVDLCRDSSPNQILAAQLPRKATLQEMLGDMNAKVRQFAGSPEARYYQDRGFGIRDVLLVPNLNWEIRHRFAALEGSDKRFLSPGFSGYHIAKALQTIRFKLDRSGAELASEAQVICKPMATYFVCSGPFLIVVKKRDAEQPFFVMWVDNAELLSKPSSEAPQEP